MVFGYNKANVDVNDKIDNDTADDGDDASDDGDNDDVCLYFFCACLFYAFPF